MIKNSVGIVAFLTVIFLAAICRCIPSYVPPPPPKETLLVFGLESRQYNLNLKAYKDPDQNLSQYKTYGFDYTNKENPLLEKELFKMLEYILTGQGLKRNEENPDILVTMNFFTGKKEKYTPPQQITTSRIEQVWSTGMFGWTVTGGYTPVEVQETQTIPEKTEIRYYRNIRLNFFDYAKLKGKEKLEIPPFLWIGEVDNEGELSDIRTGASVMMGELLNNFSGSDIGIETQRKIVETKCGTIGIKGNFNPKKQRLIIAEIEAGTPAAAAGLHKEDTILKINGKYVWVSFDETDTFAVAKTDLYGTQYPRTDEVELEVRCPHSKTTPKVRLTPKEVIIKRPVK